MRPKRHRNPPGWRRAAPAMLPILRTRTNSKFANESARTPCRPACLRDSGRGPGDEHADAFDQPPRVLGRPPERAWAVGRVVTEGAPAQDELAVGGGVGRRRAVVAGLGDGVVVLGDR